MSYDALPLDVLPGIFKESSGYAAQGRYIDGSNVRFWKGFPERIGGNAKIADEACPRPPRTMMAWRALNSTQLIALAHARGVHVLLSGSMYDVSPLGTGGYSTLTLTTGSVTGGPFLTGEAVTTTNGGSGYLTKASASSPLYVSGDNGTLKVNMTSVSGTFFLGEPVVFSGGGSARVMIGGSSSPIYVYDDTGTTTGTITGSHSGATATVSSTDVLWTGTVTGGTSGATATISGVSETNAVDSGVITVWGEGTWGSSVWGGVESIYLTINDAQVWSLATWGEDLVCCPRGGKIYTLDTSAFLGATTTNMTAVSGAPSDALGIIMSDTNRTLIAYGAHDGTNSDLLNIRWCDEEDYTVWTAAASNTAGSLRCENGSLIVGVMRARGTFLFSTDTAIYQMRYTGAPYFYGLNLLALGSTMIGQNAWAEQDGVTYWMGKNGFYMYDGSVTPLTCDVHAYVFGRINVAQGIKVCCGTLRAYNEIWWWYTSKDATENDSYVAYNTIEKTWHIGTKARTAWVDSNVAIAYPTATKSTGLVQAEEYGTSDDGEDFSYELGTADIEVSDGTVFLHNRMIIPDFDRATGTHSVEIETRGWPQRGASVKGPFSVSGTTEKISVRARGRTLRYRLSGSSDFRLGRWRTRVTGHGRVS